MGQTSTPLCWSGPQDCRPSSDVQTAVSASMTGCMGGTHGPARATTLASRECQGSARRLSVPGSRPDEFGVSIERHSPRLESHQAVLPSDSLDAGTGSRQTTPDTSPCQRICLRVSGQIDRFWFGLVIYMSDVGTFAPLFWSVTRMSDPRPNQNLSICPLTRRQIR